MKTKKEQLLTIMGLFTATGLMMVAMGLLSMPQDPSLSYLQLLQQLWEQRPVFSGVVMVYFSMMFLCDAWVAVGMIYDSRRPKKNSLKPGVVHRKAFHTASPELSLEKI